MNAIASQRLYNQYITRPFRGSAADAVAWFGAVQAQEYAHARWALALRMRDGTRDADIVQAVDEGRILRTHVMRPTWHFVTPADVYWMLELTAPRVHRAMSTYQRQMGLDAALCRRATRIFERNLRDGRCLTRPELGERLARAGVPLKGTPLALVTMYAELERVICSGPFRGKQLTYALLPERAPKVATLPRDEALAELTRRYFTSHGPATVRDFVWWSGLMTTDAKRGLEINRATSTEVEGVTYWTIGRAAAGRSSRKMVHLLPIYDEYVVAYRDRDAVPLRSLSMTWTARDAVTFQHAVIIDGHVAGTWRTTRKGDEVTVGVFPLTKLSAVNRRAVAAELERYSRFLNAPVTSSI